MRAASAEVARRAHSVYLDADALEGLADRLAADRVPSPRWDTEHHHRGSDASTLAFVLVLDALNFGSGWFPRLRKRPGMSGYYTVATALKERFDARGPFSTRELRFMRATDCARLFGQDPGDPEPAELMELFAEALRELGTFLEARFGGSGEALVAVAERSAARLVTLLAEMPGWRDVARHGELTVPFYKRAQITAWDLSLAFEGRGPGRFHDLDRLTCFADNLVPHVLRREGVLRVEPELARRIEAGERIASGAPEEVELRAHAVHAVERLVAALARRGVATRACDLDHLLWHRGQKPEMKAHPRHRTRSRYY